MKFTKDKKYKFDFILYKSWYIKKIKEFKDKKEINNAIMAEKAYQEGLNTFVKELCEGKYTFPVVNFGNGYIGLYTCKSNNETYIIEPEWCREV